MHDHKPIVKRVLITPNDVYFDITKVSFCYKTVCL